jgi:hypothetical protein
MFLIVKKFNIVIIVIVKEHFKKENQLWSKFGWAVELGILRYRTPFK